MAEHKLKAGLDFIDGLKYLGTIMGYHVETEVLLDDKNINSPAIDIGWFKEKNQKFPLFIFEIESIASNGMVFNPLKVFSQKNEKFEKPLFFFQVILKAGKNSSRIRALKQTYGTYNYRIYRLSRSEGQNFLFDILEQHRRISQELPFVHFFNFLLQEKWIEFKLAELTRL